MMARNSQKAAWNDFVSVCCEYGVKQVSYGHVEELTVSRARTSVCAAAGYSPSQNKNLTSYRYLIHSLLLHHFSFNPHAS